MGRRREHERATRNRGGGGKVHAQRPHSSIHVETIDPSSVTARGQTILAFRIRGHMPGHAVPGFVVGSTQGKNAVPQASDQHGCGHARGAPVRARSHDALAKAPRRGASSARSQCAAPNARIGCLQQRLRMRWECLRAGRGGARRLGIADKWLPTMARRICWALRDGPPGPRITDPTA